MNICLKFMGLGLLSLLMLSVIVNLDFTTAQTSGLNAANTVVDQAFNTLYSAEKAGANVTSLLNRLNNAAALLAEAENMFRNGDINSADAKTDEAVSIARQIVGEAQYLKETAETSSFSTLAITIIGIAVSILALFIVWHLFKGRYIRSNANFKWGCSR